MVPPTSARDRRALLVSTTSARQSASEGRSIAGAAGDGGYDIDRSQVGSAGWGSAKKRHTRIGNFEEDEEIAFSNQN